MYKMRWEGANTTLGNISCPSANHEVTTLDLHWSHHVPPRKKNQVNIMRHCKPWQDRLRYTFFVKFIKLKPHFEIQRTPCMGCFVLPLCPESFLYITRLVVFCSLVGFFLCLNDVFKEWVQMVLQMDFFFANLMIPITSVLINIQLQPRCTRLRRVYIRFTKCPEP